MALLEVEHIQKIYTTRFGQNRVQALSDVSFTVEKGEYVAIMGESGSGKTTLLNILAALDKPTRGVVRLDGRELTAVSEKELSAFRRDHLGFVFQDFNLLDTFSLRDNVLLPLVLRGEPWQKMDGLLAPIPHMPADQTVELWRKRMLRFKTDKGLVLRWVSERDDIPVLIDGVAVVPDNRTGHGGADVWRVRFNWRQCGEFDFDGANL